MYIRPITNNDTVNIHKVYTYYIENTSITFEEQIPSIEDFHKRIQSISERYPYLIAEDHGQLIGFAYATQFRGRSAYRWIVEVAVYVDVNHQGKGAGKKLLTALLGILDKLGYYDAYSVITLPNDRSVKLFESSGFIRNTVLKNAGYKHNTWCDAGVWVKILRQRGGIPSEPESFADYIKKYKNGKHKN